MSAPASENEASETAEIVSPNRADALAGRSCKVGSILQVTPTVYSRSSIIGGGEKIVLNIDRALRHAAQSDGMHLEVSVLAVGVESAECDLGQNLDYRIVPGRPWDARSIDADLLINALGSAETVYVNQALTQIGLFVAAHARLLKRRVIGVDCGGGDYPMLAQNPELAHIFDAFHAISEFAVTSFKSFDVPVHVVRGPVDTEMFTPPSVPMRDPKLLAAVGRIMPHKGFDRIVRALPSSLSLMIVGQPYDAEYVSHLKKLALGKQVTLSFDLSDQEVLSLLRRASLFVHASTHYDYRGTYIQKPELLGLAPLEALSCGLPTLVSNAAALPELAALPGCLCFKDDHDLAEMLDAHSKGTLTVNAESEIHAAVDAQYGLLSFGRALLRVFSEVSDAYPGN